MPRRLAWPATGGALLERAGTRRRPASVQGWPAINQIWTGDLAIVSAWRRFATAAGREPGRADRDACAQGSILPHIGSRTALRES